MDNNYLIKEIKTLSNEKINRNSFYWVAIPFTEKRPLQIFEKVENEFDLGKKQSEVKNQFDGHIDKMGKRYSDIIDVIVRHKRRLALIVQNDEYNKKENYNFVYVVPITTFNSNDSKIEYFKKNMDIAHYQYIGKITGKESVAI